jgi:hypothetical protein
MIVNNVKFVYNRSKRSGWRSTGDIFCHICSKLMLKSGVRLSKTKLYTKDPHRSPNRKHSYFIFCSTNCREIHDMNPLAYE